MMGDIVTVVVWLLLLSGGFFMVTGSLGMVRLPDVFTRMHAAGMVDTMGAGLTLAGLCVYSLHDGTGLVAVRLVLVLGFLWFTSPIATHAVAKAALSGGTTPYTVGDARLRAGQAGAGPDGAGEGRTGAAPDSTRKAPAEDERGRGDR
ncbi:MAG: monovalent cation/H(+) antiporter subunit G [Gemmatimonadota bacterium]|nr:monovalent cation/H(+) antiporter subunit G [Gemmatimonadota bacterium]